MVPEILSHVPATARTACFVVAVGLALLLTAAQRFVTAPRHRIATATSVFEFPGLFLEQLFTTSRKI